jgi:hypothetical protein
MAYSTVTLTGTYLGIGGAPASGSVEIVPSVKRIVDAGGDVILSGRLTATLDEDGAFSIDLPATDDDRLNPTGFGYTVIVRLRNGQHPAVALQLPATPDAVDMADVTPVDPATFAPDATYASLAELDALAADVTGLDGDLSAETDARAAADALLIPLAQKGAASGVAALDSGSRVAEANLPANLAAATLAATYGALTNSTPFAALMAALREGQDDVAIGLVGDSTGDATDEWLYLVGQYLATTFPAYTVRHRVWSDATQAFAAPTTIQTGTGAVERAVVLDPGGTVAAVAYPGANITGDLDISVKVKAVDWSNGTQTFCAKFGASGNRSFRFQINSSGFLIFDWSVDGTALQTVASSGTIVPHADGSIGWVRVVLDVDNGAGGHAIKFYNGSDGIAWTQLGSTVTRATGATSVFASTYDYELGARTGTAEPLTGGARLYEAQIRDGIDGPTVAPRVASLWNRGVGTGVATIEGAPILTLVNGSHLGAALSYLNEATRYKKLTPDFGQAVVFFSDSHNEANTVGQAWINLLSSWVTNVLTRHPMAAPVLLTQNPRYSPAAYIAEHARRRRQTMGWAKQRGYSVVDTYRAFLDNGGGAALINADGIHPTQTALTGGQTVWKNAITALLT